MLQERSVYPVRHQDVFFCNPFSKASECGVKFNPGLTMLVDTMQADA